MHSPGTYETRLILLLGPIPGLVYMTHTIQTNFIVAFTCHNAQHKLTLDPIHNN